MANGYKACFPRRPHEWEMRIKKLFGIFNETDCLCTLNIYFTLSWCENNWFYWVFRTICLSILPLLKDRCWKYELLALCSFPVTVCFDEIAKVQKSTQPTIKFNKNNVPSVPRFLNWDCESFELTFRPKNFLLRTKEIWNSPE